MTDPFRSAICRMDILRGGDVLRAGQECGRHLYNFTRYCGLSYNRRLARARGHESLAGRLPKYPGFFGIAKAMQGSDEYRLLNTRMAGYVLREFDAHMRSWFSGLKGNLDARPPRYSERARPLVFEVGANAKYRGDNTWFFTVLSVRNPDRHVTVKIHLPPTTCPERVKSIKVLHDGRCAVSYRLRPKSRPGRGVAAIDLGVRRLATVALDNGESIMYTSAMLLSMQQYFSKKMAKCKPSGYERGKDNGKQSKRLKAYAEKYAKQKHLALHNITASIIKECLKRGVGTIVVGDLKGIREGKNFGRRINQQLHAWPFAQVVQLLTYKAENHGMEVVKISERNTSKTCSICGHLNKQSARKHRGELTCAACGVRINADVNGAFNILKKYLLGPEGLGVMGGLPALPSPTASASGSANRSQISPTFVAKLDLRNLAVSLHSC